MATRIALEHKIPPSTLKSLVKNESQWNPHAISKTKDYGLVQINLDSWPDVTKEEAFDPEFALNFAAEKIAKKQEYLWTVCNCWSYVKVHIPSFPSTKNLKVEGYIPTVGAVVIMNYSGTPHYGIVQAITSEGIQIRDANFKPCTVQTHTVEPTSPHILGYWYS